MMKYVKFYESSDGHVFAIVYKGKEPINLVSEIESGSLIGADLVYAAKTGFQFADTYDPNDWGGVSLKDTVDEIEYRHEEIAEVFYDYVVLYNEYMGKVGKLIFKGVK